MTNVSKKSSDPSQLIGRYGKIKTFGSSVYQISRLVMIAGYCPKQVNLQTTPLLIYPEAWANVQDYSECDRIIVLTPKLTTNGYLSPTNKRIGITPQLGRIQNHFQEMEIEQWMDEINKLHPPTAKGQFEIATIEMWTPSALKAFVQGNTHLTHLNEIISLATMISPEQDWERIDELLEESAEFAKTDLASQAPILESLLDIGLTIGEMIRFFSRENAKKRYQN